MFSIQRNPFHLLRADPNYKKPATRQQASRLVYDGTLSEMEASDAINIVEDFRQRVLAQMMYLPSHLDWYGIEDLLKKNRLSSRFDKNLLIDAIVQRINDLGEENLIIDDAELDWPLPATVTTADVERTVPPQYYANLLVDRIHARPRAALQDFIDLVRWVGETAKPDARAMFFEQIHDSRIKASLSRLKDWELAQTHVHLEKHYLDAALLCLRRVDAPDIVLQNAHQEFSRDKSDDAQLTFLKTIKARHIESRNANEFVPMITDLGHSDKKLTVKLLIFVAVAAAIIYGVVVAVNALIKWIF